MQMTRSILALSQACLLGHTYIGSEHLLLGLLLEGSTGSCAALHQRGVHAEAVLEQLIKTVGRGIQSRLSPADMTRAAAAFWSKAF